MTPALWLAVGGLFVSVALLTGLGASALLARNSPERRRLRAPAFAGSSLLIDQGQLTEEIGTRLKALASKLPKSPKDMTRLRKRLASAGIYSFGPAVCYSLAELGLPLLFAAAVLTKLHDSNGMVLAAIMAGVGYLLPGLVLARLVKKRKLRIENGLPDALDLIIVCVEAGCSLDQGILKTTDELQLSHPDLALEMRTITTEVRAGKPRVEAFKNFAERTRVDDVRALVAMLVQTDRFGTSIAQALRTHAITARMKRRQRAEEKAAKVGVKMVFPLVFFLFPAFYVVTLGPAVILFIRSNFFGN